MLFNSLQFLIFFPIVTLLYFLLPLKWRWALLLIASCYFYMALIPVYILVLFFLILVDYFAAILIEPAAGSRRRFYLILSLLANISILGFFKYFNFINTNFASLYALMGGDWSIANLSFILPIGLSFHTFQSISYTIEVYRGRQKAERHLGIYALYVLFYPQLVAGPIERPQHMLHQFREEHPFDYQRVTDGLKLMMWGMFKKVVIADRLAEAVGLVYDNPTAYHGLPLIVATYYFAIQIYCDFSGYSDIAIGAAQVMGFRLMENFNRPYHAVTVADFWKRWHISLSTWFRDYVLFGLGGNRARWRFSINVVLTFLLSGLWHGAAWTFVVWGGLHGVYLVASNVSAPLRRRVVKAVGLDRYPRVHKIMQIVITFHLVWVSWIFFRAQSVWEAVYIIRNMMRIEVGGGLRGIVPAGGLLLDRVDLVIVMGAVVMMEVVHQVERRREMRSMLREKPLIFRWAVYYVLIMSILLFGKLTGAQHFIYFQF
jgi:D-alanyl-lipoteichoic acid acyltransferase DltB (MBOAT superfamily)